MLLTHSTTQITEANMHQTQPGLISSRCREGMKQTKGTPYLLKHFTLVSILILTCICAEIWTASIVTVVKIDSRHLTSSTIASVAMLENVAHFMELFPQQTEKESNVNILEHDTSMIPVVGETSKNDSQIVDKLKIVWLMSFPNSGTSYTTKLIRSMTQTHTASNYGFEHQKKASEPSIRVFDDQPNGPFFVDVDVKAHPERTNPKKFVLTKTHCGLRCEDCPPRKYLETTFSFRSRCSESNWIEIDKYGQPQIVYGTYSQSLVAKAIHLIRDPFDNIVSRFHLEQHERKKRQSKILQYPFDRNGFRSYCKALHQKHVHDEMQFESLIEVFKNLTAVPCGTDFLRFTEWHNLVFTTTRDMNIDTYTLYYDEYETNFTQTTENLVNFLELNAVADPFPFKVGKIYREYFAAEELVIVKRAVEWMSSPTTWDALKRYFHDVE